VKAIVYPEYGLVQFQEVAKPAPKENEVLIQVYAASINAFDRHFLRGKPFLIRIMAGNGLRKPKDPRLGVDLAGRVAAVGRSVTQFKPGDEVFGRGQGAFAEYACARETSVVLKPPTLSFEQAAAVPIAALTAVGALRDKAQVQPGQKVLIQGASGAVGTFAVQLAKILGAEVTAVCSTRNVEQARALGANHVIDYTHEDFTKNSQQYDVILAVNGYHSIFAYRRALRPGGIYLMVGAATARLIRSMLQAMILGPLLTRMGDKRLAFFSAPPTPEQLAFLKELLETGQLVSAVEKCYPLREAATAIRYMEAGHPRGKIVLTVDQATQPA
jgi:NADPH:quinone reductase-like Zn-dependent oxidoreductase